MQHLKHDHLHPAVIATNRRENPFHAACTYNTPCTYIYIYMNIKYIKREMEGEGRKGSCSHRHDLILLGQNLFGFLCARPRRLPAESIIYPVVLFVQRSANQRADGIESGASLTREEEREGRVGQGRSWISRSDKTFHLILDRRFRVYILSSDR